MSLCFLIQFLLWLCAPFKFSQFQKLILDNQASKTCLLPSGAVHKTLHLKHNMCFFSPVHAGDRKTNNDHALTRPFCCAAPPKIKHACTHRSQPAVGFAWKRRIFYRYNCTMFAYLTSFSVFIFQEQDLKRLLTQDVIRDEKHRKQKGVFYVDLDVDIIVESEGKDAPDYMRAFRVTSSASRVHDVMTFSVLLLAAAFCHLLASSDFSALPSNRKLTVLLCSVAVATPLMLLSNVSRW